jgi:predicted dehydrogenase
VFLQFTLQQTGFIIKTPLKKKGRITMKKLRVAIIGQGRSGRDIHGNYFLTPENNIVEVVAVVDAIADRRERAKKDFGCDVYEHYTELFATRDIDLIVNASFSQEHYPIAKDRQLHG